MTIEDGHILDMFWSLGCDTNMQWLLENQNSTELRGKTGSLTIIAIITMVIQHNW